MRVPRSLRFDEQAERFALQFTCEDCVHFDEARVSCGHSWPTAEHRRARYAAGSKSDEVVFCKEFEAS